MLKNPCLAKCPTVPDNDAPTLDFQALRAALSDKDKALQHVERAYQSLNDQYHSLREDNARLKDDRKAKKKKDKTTETDDAFKRLEEGLQREQADRHKGTSQSNEVFYLPSVLAEGTAAEVIESDKKLRNVIAKLQQDKATLQGTYVLV